MPSLPFLLLRLNPLGQRKLPIVISLSRMLCFGRVCAFPCALNVCAALQGAYIPTRSMDRKRFDEVRKADHVCRETLLRFRRTTCCFYDPIALTSNKKRRATFPSSKQRNLPICVPLWQPVRWSHVSALRRANQTTHSKVDCQSSNSTHPSKPSPPR